jgi:uncharacterized NAD(P)/FAD-binding protein YdhS
METLSPGSDRSGAKPSVRREKLPLAVIGGGFSGTMAAIHLARALPSDQPVLLCERGTGLGLGVAYSTSMPGHLLNVCAANMSAFESDPGHFEARLRGWLRWHCRVE